MERVYTCLETLEFLKDKAENINISDTETELKNKLDGFKQKYIDAMDDATFDVWMKYHFSICERMDLIGATNHALDILEKINK